MDRFTFRYRVVAVVAAGVGLLILLRTSSAQEIVGVQVTPHAYSTEMRWRKPPEPELSAKTELFVRNTSREPWRIPTGDSVRFDGHTANALLEQNHWSWHDTPAVWQGEYEVVPPDGLTVLKINGKSTAWGTDTSHQLDFDSGLNLSFDIRKPHAWLSAVTFLATDQDQSSPAIYPNRVVVHVKNDGSTPFTLKSLQIWLPVPNASHHVFSCERTYETLDCFPQDRKLPPGEHGGFAITGPTLPLSYAVLEVIVQRPGQPDESLWAHVRIKREVFDISGGWVSSDVNGRNSLSFPEYRQTLKRMHINTAQIEEVAGYTDNPVLYAELPLKRFNRLWPLSHYDTDAMLPTIHAVEFLGEPQYGGGRPVPPQEVWEKLAPYQTSRLATTITLSEEHSWRYYAGLSDYPHYDAYRVTAPAADAWGSYDRWNGVPIRWGAPLETIGTMTRSLRDHNRPRPIAYWAQGAHHDWRSWRNPRRGSPTPDELRSQAWHGLANRITSLYWFNLSLKSLVMFPDLIEPITRVNREIRMLEPLFLEGDAYEYHRIESDTGMEWDLTSIATADTVLLVAHDLAYRVDSERREFVFDTRAGTFQFQCPRWLAEDALYVFRVDADGTHDVVHSVADGQISIEDSVQVVGIYLATNDAGLRARIDAEQQRLVEHEAACRFDPGNDRDDLGVLRKLLE
jgi:hypothetical protein